MLGRLRTLTCSAYRIPHTTTRTIITRASKLPAGSSILINRASRTPTPIVIPPAIRNWQTADPRPETSSKSSSPDAARTVQIERRPTNSQIPFDMVRVIDPKTHKLSQTTQSLKELIDATNLHRYCIELVSPNTENPIVRVVPKAEVEEKYKQMKKALRKGQRSNGAPKEVRLMWGVAKADLEHKLRKGKGHLEKGHRLIFSISLRPRQPRPTREEKDALMGEIAAAVNGLAVEWKPMGISGKQTLLYYKPPNAEDDPQE